MGMDDKTFYSQLMGVETPWKVASVDLLVNEKRVEIRVECEQEVWADELGRRMHIHGYQQRTWRHLDTCQCQTLIIARVPRLKDEDAKTQLIPVPWAEKNSRFTEMFEGFAIRVLKASASVSAACKLLGISWDEADAIMKRAVERGMARRKPEVIHYIGLDEKSFLRGHQYVSVMSDIQGKRVLDVAFDRNTDACNELWDKLTAEQREGVEAVAMDMWEPYRKSTEQRVPQGAIVHDKFHISKHLNEGVDQIRRQEHKELMKEGDERLKGTKYSWLKDHKEMSRNESREFRSLKNEALKVSRAWSIKELFREIWHKKTEGGMRRFFKKWYGWASRCQLKPLIKKARMIRDHLERVVTYATHPISNAMAEALNAQIQTLVTNARGFRNKESFRARILFFCGNLNLAP